MFASKIKLVLKFLAMIHWNFETTLHLHMFDTMATLCLCFM
jgi:hypothetical protein